MRNLAAGLLLLATALQFPSTIAQTNAPTVSPTLPTAMPTLLPTATPTTAAPSVTSAPTTATVTKSPTRSPQFSLRFFTGFPDIKSLDAYFIFDLSESTTDYDSACKRTRRLNGQFATNCWDLYISFAQGLVQELADGLTYASPSKPANIGLRVGMFAFSCDRSQLQDVVIDVLPNLTGDRTQINSAFARLQRMMPKGGSCPGLAFDRVVRLVEDNWPSSPSRPFKALFTITDGFIYDFKLSATRRIMGAPALRQRCVQTSVVPFRVGGPSLNPAMKSVQIRGLSQMSGDFNRRTFRLDQGVQKAIDQVQNNLGAFLNTAPRSAACTTATLYNLPPNRYCGYASTMCSNRFGCFWNPTAPGVSGGACFRVQNCNYPRLADCARDPRCITTNNRCVPRVNCGALTTSGSCSANASCRWSNGVCVNK